MNIVAHIIAFNEELILPYALRHYGTFCSQIVVHDVGSTDGTPGIALDAGAILKRHDSRGEFDDSLNERIKNTEWKSLPCDWVMMLDCDEFLYFPHGERVTLATYDLQGLPVIKPRGFEMLGDELPSKGGQIYDEIKHGAYHVDYCKPVLFSPNRVSEIRLSTGAHSCNAILKDGSTFSNPTEHPSPATLLLHYHQIGGLERIAAKYDAVVKRMSEANRRNKWGWQSGPGMVHALQKRNLIQSKMEQVVP